MDSIIFYGNPWEIPIFNGENDDPPRLQRLIHQVSAFRALVRDHLVRKAARESVILCHQGWISHGYNMDIPSGNLT